MQKKTICLPVFVGDDVLHQNPQFGFLLQSLSHKCLAEDGSSHSHVRQLAQTQRQLDVMKQSYLQNMLILDTVREMIQEQHLCSDGQHRDTLVQLGKLLSVAEAQQVLEQVNTLSTTKCMFLNNSSEWLQQINEVQALADYLESSIQSHILPELDERLQSKLETIVTFYEPFQTANQMFHLNDEEQLNLYGESPQKSFMSQQSHSSASPGFTANSIRKEKQELAEQKKQLRRQQTNLQHSYFVYHQKLWQVLTVITEMVEDFKLSQFANLDKVSLEWLKQRIVTMHKKLQVLKFQYMNALYDTRTIPTLKRMRAQLEKEYESTEESLANIGFELEEYKKVGDGFDQLVDEYSQMLRKIEEKQWQLQQLQIHNQSRSSSHTTTSHMNSNPTPTVTSQPKQQDSQKSRPRQSYSSAYDQELRALLDDDDPYTVTSSLNTTQF